MFVLPLCVAEVAAAEDTGAPVVKTIGDRHVSRPPRLPSPVAIPQQFSPPQEAFASFPPSLGAGPASPPRPSACQTGLAKVAVFKTLPLLAGPGECGAVDAVLLESVILPDQAKVSIAPPATLRCSMAETIAVWLREDVAPAALKLGAPLRGLDNFDSYECRGRNRVRGATLSEHGRANALDVRGFRLGNGEVVTLTDEKVAKEWREALRGSVCARFSTVLGPGSDGNHEEHIHLDLAERRAGYKMCEWDVRVPLGQEVKTQTEAAEHSALIDQPVPLPRPRPVAAAAKIVSGSKKMRSQLR